MQFRLPKFILFLSGLCIAEVCVSQTDGELITNYDDWYQVEVIIFERGSAYASSSSEIWPSTIDLNYPTERLAFLKSEEDLLQLANEVKTDEEMLEKTFSGLSDNAQLLEETPTLIEDNAEIQSATVDIEAPFTLLPSEKKTLTSAARRLNNRRGYRILFHEAWRQPFLRQENSPWIVIQGGDFFAEHSELEGSINLNKGRYLHLNTNLWLTRFEANYGQDQTYWPNLPAVPKPKQDAEIQSELDSSSSNSFSQFSSELAADNTTANEPNYFSYGGSNTSELLNQEGLFSYQSYESSPYVVKEIITLEQSRRMRSEEFHYIDHPAMGLLVKVIPYEGPEVLQPNE